MTENATKCGDNTDATKTSSTKKIALAERYRIFNSIEEFKPFQIEIMEKIGEFKRIAIEVDTGVGKTTMMKYLALDFVDLSRASNRCLVLANTRALAYDISSSIEEILDEDERGLVCNLNNYDAQNRITRDVVDKARIFVAVPDKYRALMRTLPRHFQFVCVDEVDSLLDKSEPETSTILDILESITCAYLLACSATFTPNVYTYIIDKYCSASRTFTATISNVDIKRIRYDKSDKNWSTSVCDKIHHIILENPLLNKVIVFCNYRNDCDRLFDEYKMCGSQPNYCIHGNMPTQQIQQSFRDYKTNGKVLFTTDMCQRGLDVKNIDIVFHVGYVGEVEFYHRNGRTLRQQHGDMKPLCFMFLQARDLRENPALGDLPEKYFEHDGSGSSHASNYNAARRQNYHQRNNNY